MWPNDLPGMTGSSNLLIYDRLVTLVGVGTAREVVADCVSCAGGAAPSESRGQPTVAIAGPHVLN